LSTKSLKVKTIYKSACINAHEALIDIFRISVVPDSEHCAFFDGMYEKTYTKSQGQNQKKRRLSF